MDAGRFDALVRSLTAVGTRRGAIAAAVNLQPSDSCGLPVLMMRPPPGRPGARRSERASSAGKVLRPKERQEALHTRQVPAEGGGNQLQWRRHLSTGSLRLSERHRTMWRPVCAAVRCRDGATRSPAPAASS